MPAPAQNPAQLDVEDEHAREERIGAPNAGIQRVQY
jgi:hypothetical protein